jgi:hypothetical protein
MKWLQLRRHRVSLATIVTLLGLATLGLSATSANAAPNDPIRFSSYLITPMPTLDPLVPPDHLVTMRGTYKNTTDAFISELNLDLAIFGPITTRTQLGELLLEPNNFGNLAVTTTKTSARLRNLAPGVTKTWQVTFRGEQVLGSGAVGVFAVGLVPQSSEYGPSAAIAIPWFFNSAVQPTKVVLAVPITTLNTNLADGTSISTASDLSEADRLSAILRSQGNSSVSWLVDSAISTWANNLVTNTNTAAAEELVAALATLPAGVPVVPYGHADISALVRAGKQAEFGEVIARTSQSSAGNPIFYTPASGESDRTTISLLNTQNVRSIISNKSIHDNERVTTPASVTSSSNRVLVFDVASSNCLKDMESNEDSFFRATSCLKAEIGMITAESPQIARSIIVLAPSNWEISSQGLTDLLLQLSNHNWMQLAPLQEIAGQEPTQSFIALNSGKDRDFSRGLLRLSDEIKVNTESVSALYVDPELAASFTAARLLGYSDLWSSNTQAIKYFEQNSKLLNEYLDAIQLEASAQITTPQASSEIPITIVNTSDRDVSVSLALTSASTSRFSAQPSGLIQVAQGQRVTVPVSISLIGAGIVTVQAQLIAPNGERFGVGKEIQISSAAYSQFARTLVLGAFGLLLALALSNYLKRLREGRRVKSNQVSTE